MFAPASRWRLIANGGWTRLHPGGFIKARMLIASDGEEHFSLRNIVNRGFTPKHIAAWEPRARAMAEESVAPLRAGEADAAPSPCDQSNLLVHSTIPFLIVARRAATENLIYKIAQG